MKTDKFDDAIRRKLESIEPPFRERDWSHMQSFMHHHGYPPTWTGVGQWLMPLSAAAAVTGLIVSTVWQFYTNQQLRQSVQTLNQTVSRLETTQATLIKQQPRTDTIYVTNFTKTPASANPGQPTGSQFPQALPPVRTENRYVHQPSLPAPATDQPASRLEADHQRPTATDNGLKSSPPAATDQLTQRTAPAQRIEPLATSPGLATEQPLVGIPAESANTTGSERTALRPNSTQTRVPQPHQTERLHAYTPLAAGTKASRPAAAQPVAGQTQPATESYAVINPSAGRSTDRRSTEVNSSVPDKQEAVRQVDNINPLSNRPMTLGLDSAYYGESLARRTRRIRSLFPATVTVLPATTAPTAIAPTNAAPTDVAPTDVASSRPAFGGIKVRLGLSGEIGTVQRAKGIYSEVLIGKHWSVGVGLNQVNLKGSQFSSEDQFKRMTHEDFRHIYAPRIDPLLDIVDIDQQFVLWRLPVNLSYRALLTKGFALVPSVGMDFNLASQENTTFTYRRGPYEHNVLGLPPDRPCSSFNTYTVAIGAEKNWKHVVLQAGPVLSMPTKTLLDPVNPVSLGLRTRLLFQF